MKSWVKKLTKAMAGVLAAVLFVGSFAAFADNTAITAEAAISGAPATEKRLIDNGDGTYTLALSVTGQAESSTQTDVTRANVILVLDTSSSMNSNQTTYDGQRMTRLNAEKHVLCDNGGIIDTLLSQNTAQYSDIIEIAVANFGTRGTTAQTFTSNATALKNTINNLGYNQGTNWEEGLMRAQELAASIKATQPEEEVYIIFLTDGEPTTHYNDYTVNINFAQEWGYANDNARAIVNAGYHFYGIFTWGSSSSSSYLASLVQYAYTGSGTATTPLDPAYADYFTDATDTETLIDALEQISHSITESVGYTNVELEDGVTTMTASSVSATATGEITGLRYYRSGGPYSTTANNGLGEEWDEAPHATINDAGKVDWDLGTMTLENGVTYTVTFVVWPSQDALDLVADLNNGVVQYDDLTADQRSQIAVSGGHYTLKTNTDYPEVTYSTVTTTTVDGETTTVTSDPITTRIQNPDPVGLAEARLDAVKEWEDSLDPSQRSEVADVDLYLLVDGEPYYVDPETEEPLSVHLTAESDWTHSDYISIAPGLMVTEDSPAYDPDATHVTWNGHTYAIIEPGHEYVFEESDINNHFELTAYTHHPMIMGTRTTTDEEGNTVTVPNIVDVIFTKDASGNITGIESVVPLGDNLSATNTLKGGINITKVVVDETGAEINDPNPFSITVEVTDPNRDPLPPKTTTVDGEEVSYTIDYRIYYGPNNPNYNAASGGGRSDHIYVNGTSFTETIYVGDTIRVVNVEDDSLYRVTETVPTGYSNNYTVDYTIAYGTGRPAAFPEGEAPSVQGNSASYAEITNTYAYGSLQVSKVVEVESGNAEQARAKEFEFTFHLYTDASKTTELTGNRYPYTITRADGTTATGTVTVGETFTLKDGESIVINQLPEGAYYEVAETAASGYETEATGAAGTVEKNTTAEAEFTNTYSVTPIRVDPPVKKEINNEDLYNNGAFTFVIENTAAPEGVTAPMPDNTSITNSAQYERVGDAYEEDMPSYYEFGPIEFTAPGEYTYTVTESGHAPGVTNDSAATKTITFTVTDKGDGTLSVSPGTDSAVFTFTNEYRTGQLSISKTVVNPIDSEDDTEFTFTVEFKDGNDTVEGSFPYTIGETTGNIASGGTLSLSNGETAVITGIPDGVTYTVTETPVDGYTITAKTGDTGTISATTAAAAAFTNTYAATGTATITVTKAIAGAAWPTGQELTFTLTGANGAPMSETTTATITAAGNVSFGPIAYDTNDAGQTYTYTISEGDGFGDGWTGSGDITATVEVTDNGDGSLHTDITYSPENATITNTYEAEGEATITVTKAITGAAWPSGKTLTFTLTGSTGAPMPETTSVTVSAAGDVSFGPIAYDESDAGQTYTYTISEDGFGDGWTGSGDITATVAVTDEGDGTLSTEVTYSPETATITNTYTATGSAEIQVSKILQGRDWLEDESFTFTMTDSGGNTTTATVTEEAPTASFPVSFTQADIGKTFTYEITETGTLPGGVTQSGGPITASITVTDNGNGTLSAPVTYTYTNEDGEAESTDDPAITNTYVAAPTNVTITVNKTVPDPVTDLPDETFTFVLLDEDGKQVDSKTATTTSANGYFDSVNFDALRFTRAGDYTYTVRETQGSIAGYTYDTTEYTVVVHVVDNLQGQLVASVAVDDAESVAYTEPIELDMVNTYTRQAYEVQLTATKVITDESLSAEDHEFTFQLLDANDEVVSEKTVTTSELQATITFDKITITEPGDYTYTIHEVDTGIPGFTYAEDQTVTLTVTPNWEFARLDGPAASDLIINIENVYRAEETEAVLQVTKAIDDTTGDAYPTEFTFTLEAVGEAPMPETAEGAVASVTGEGVASFGAITYKQAGTFEYTITETQGDATGYTYDTTAHQVTVTVTDVEGQLVADVNYDGAESTESNESSTELVVTNVYDPEDAKVTLQARKVIDDRTGDAPNAEFTFELLDADGTVIDSASRQGGGYVNFKQITYSVPGTYTYTIREVAGNAAGYTYDTTTYPVMVTVNDNQGILSAEVSYGDAEEALFTNPYEAEPVTVTLTATKTLTGREMTAGEFSFILTDANGETCSTGTNDASGAVTFEPITYTHTGIYEYQMSEVAGEAGGVTYDQNAVVVTVEVNDNGQGQLVANVIAGADASFTNTYVVTPVDAQITARKVLTGRDLQANEFTFQLLDAAGNVVATAKNDAEGKISFEAINYTEAGTYTYTIVEVAGSEAGMTYDSHRFTVTVEVTDDGEGALTAEVSYANGQPVFSNIYVPPIVPTGDSTNAIVYVAIALAAAAVCLGSLIARKRAR